MYRRAFFFIAFALAAIVGCDKNPSHSPATKAVDTREQVQVTFYATRTGSKYHRDGCLFLAKSKIPIGLEEAKRRYDACSVCKPPQ